LSPPEPRIAGLILAGGLSQRLGRPKQLLPYGNGTLLEHAVREAEAVPELEPLIAVLPPGDLVPDPKVERTRIVRRQEEGGCSASLHAGLAMLPPEIDALAVLPADQPHLLRDAIALATNTWLRSRPIALTLRYQDEPCHPLIFSAQLVPDLLSLKGEKGMWRLLESLGDAVHRVEIDHPVAFDIDTREDYERLTSIMGVAGYPRPRRSLAVYTEPATRTTRSVPSGQAATRGHLPVSIDDTHRICRPHGGGAD
jgi:molybdenum cofactor cytidylyltransferase